MCSRIAFSRGATSKSSARTRAHFESLRKIVDGSVTIRIRILALLKWVKIRVVYVTRGSKNGKKSLPNVGAPNKPEGTHTIKLERLLTRWWQFRYKARFTLKFHPHHNQS